MRDKTLQKENFKRDDGQWKGKTKTTWVFRLHPNKVFSVQDKKLKEN